MLRRWFRFFKFLIIGWVIIIPIVSLSRIFLNKKYIIFIGKDDGKFLDNVKYLFLYFNKHKNELKKYGLEIVFITENKNTYKSLKKHKLPVELYPSKRSIKKMLEAKYVIVDNMNWFLSFKYFLLKSVFKIQLWHGVGFKFIELLFLKDFLKNLNYKSIQNLSDLLWKLKGFVSGRYPVYDVIVSTSQFYAKHVFSKAFRYKNIWISGYSRNDIFFRKESYLDLINVDTEIYKSILELKKNGKKIILYAPTYRDSGRNPIMDQAINLKTFVEFLRKNNLVVIFKFHNWDKAFNKDENFNLGVHKEIFIYDKDKDIYPLLKYIDLLITDYSSIYMDFLLLDKPIIFYPYDFDKYLLDSRKIQFDYNWITPGPKVYNQQGLEKNIYEILIENKDEYKEKRHQILNLAFDFKDGKASKRIFENLLDLERK